MRSFYTRSSVSRRDFSLAHRFTYLSRHRPRTGERRSSRRPRRAATASRQAGRSSERPLALHVQEAFRRASDTVQASRGRIRTAWFRLQALWPALAAMEHRDDLQTLAAHSVRNDVPCARNDELTSPRHPTGTSEIRQRRQAIDRSEKCPGRAGCRARILADNIVTKGSEMANRPRRPDDSHARGAFRSRFLPQDRSHFDTSRCATTRPLSSSSRPA
jgi:hypothetical protein